MESAATSGIIANVYPNPNSGNFNVSISSSSITSGTAKVQLIGIYGNLIMSKDIALSNGTGIASFVTTNLSSGIYEVRYLAGKEIGSTRVVIAK
jgi:hypothetical protein